MVNKAELQAKRLKAMGVAGEGMQAAADMYDRVIAAGDKVKDAVTKAEAAQMGALNRQVADLEEVAADVEDFGNQAEDPTKGVMPGLVTAAPAKTTATPSAGSAALAALQNAQPNPKAWGDGDAYHGTHPPEAPPSPENVVKEI